MRLTTAAFRICPSRGALAQLVRAPPCHGGGCGFEPRRLRVFIFIGKTTLKRNSITGIHDSFMTNHVAAPAAQDLARIVCELISAEHCRVSKEPSECSKIAWLTNQGTLWGWGILGMPVNFFSGFFGIKLQKMSRFIARRKQVRTQAIESLQG